MFSISASEAQKAFPSVIERSQQEIVSVTCRGRSIMLAMSPRVFQDYVDAQLALDAKNNGMLSVTETKVSLDRYRNGEQ
ncbi:hypothetical protein [Thiofilum flexile]|uniref:hypothetical protein n=1 Tax=Thiofilum flexile TaxID=125627 RepID=UPI00037A42CA|nr:hypothetical protein [Thiofilum flexile]